MRPHVIYYFSGTGNSLKVALSIQKALGDCDVVAMSTTLAPELKAPQSVQSIGFVFPCYFGGVPHRVQEFVQDLTFPQNESPYVYAVITYGAVAASSLSQFDELLASKGVSLDYGATLKAFSNYVVLYDMSPKAAEKTAQTKIDLQPIISDIIQQKSIGIKRASRFAIAYNRMGSKEVLSEDRNFVVHDSCTSCGICEQVCLVQNISMAAGKPQWSGRCEQCLACLQWCPERSIDYGNKTNKRGRYTHPEITTKAFISYLKGAGISDT